MNIRAATDGDRPGICTVHVRAIREACSSSHSPEQVSAWAGLLSRESYTRVLKERFMVVAADGGHVVGFGQSNLKTGEVDAVNVLPGRQGEGIGQRLLAALEKHPRTSGLGVLQLSAMLNAKSFDTHAGHVERDVAVHRLPMGLELQCIRMAKQLHVDGATPQRDEVAVGTARDPWSRGGRRAPSCKAAPLAPRR